MDQASLTIDAAFSVAAVDRRLFGSFVEHMGRCVYSGIFEPDHPSADGDGFRSDVLALVRELGVTLVRYPGGNFVSSYRWEDGVGPVAQRPARPDLAWRTVEPNAFGVDEFVAWARAADVEPMLAVNLGTRGIVEACDLLEYCNRPAGTYWADRRVAHGITKPHGVPLWCLGNELDGPWQIGAKTAAEYGRLAAETAKAMRVLDPGIELVACGSSNRSMPTFGAWEATVLEHSYDSVDYLSLHSYYDPGATDLDSFLASAVDMEDCIDSVVATADHVRAKRRARRRIQLAYDEWNVWYQGGFDPAATPWTEAPTLIEDRFTVADAVVVGSLLIALLRHADRVAIACQAQLVNVIAPICTEPGGRAWRQSIFHPFALTARLARGNVLRVEPTSPQHDTASYGPVPALHATATYDEDNGDLTVFAVNRGRQPLALTADVRALPRLAVAEHQVLADDDLSAANTADEPDRVRPRGAGTLRVTDGRLDALLPPASWNVLTARPQA